MTTAIFEYNKAKTIQALRYHFISQKSIKFMIIFVNLFSLLSAGLYFAQKISPKAFLLSTCMWMVLMLAFWFVLPYMVYGRTQTFKDMFSALLDDDGLTLTNERGSQTWAWQRFSNYVESPHFFHLYFNAQSFFLLPKEAFKTNDITTARAMFEGNIAKA
jgi:hypothetical protein